MTEIPYLQRHLEARRELGDTAIGRVVAATLVAAFVAVVAVVPVVEHLTPAGAGWGAFARLGSSATEAMSALDERGLLPTNRRVLAAMDGFDDRLAEESWVADVMLPGVQYVLTRGLGVGNQQVYLGTGRWLFFRPAVDPLFGPPFLSADQQHRRRTGGDAWSDPISPDPLPALQRLDDDLADRGIELLVVPTPVKASIHPELFVVDGGQIGAAPLHNASYEGFLRRLEEMGISHLDLAPRFVSRSGEPAVDGEPERDEPLFLATDSHWNPDGMSIAAEAIAAAVRRRLGEPIAPTLYERRSQTVVGRGDLFRLLNLPAGSRLFPQERITTDLVLTPDGGLWRPSREAAVLLLGDSFTNVFSDPGLWWGRGAGLAEQVSRLLERPVDRVARNAGGAHASRAELARQLAADADRLAEVEIVVYQFAERELSNGDWREIPLSAALDSAGDDS